MPEQADEQSLVRWESEDAMWWESRRRRPDRSSDKLTFFSLGMVMVGLVFAAIGFSYPVNLQRDPGASARENEEADQEYMQLTSALHAVVIAGMILIGLGGLVLTAVFTNTVLCEECRQSHAVATTAGDCDANAAAAAAAPGNSRHGNGERRGLPLQTSTSRPGPTNENYGTVTTEIGGQ